GPRYIVTDDGPPVLERLRLHPNSPGSRRSLERELAAVKVALKYLQEDAGMAGDPNAPRPAPRAPPGTGPVPQPPDPDTTLGEPEKISPPSAKKPGPAPVRK